MRLHKQERPVSHFNSRLMTVSRDLKRRGMILTALTLAMVILAWSGGVLSTVRSAGAADVLKHPLTDFKDGQARHFKLTHPKGREIRYFIVQDPDGEIRAAFDACDVCWKAGKGYRQDGREMICQNCGLRFPMEKIGLEKGGCNPSPLKFKVRDNQVFIDPRDVLEGLPLFDL